jgi:amino acid permease
VSFAVLLGNVAESALSNWAGLEPVPGFELVHRLAAVATVVFGILGPLCAKLDFKSMGWTSSLGITATVVTALVMFSRFSDGTYMQPIPENLGSLDAIVAEAERARSAMHSAPSSSQSNGFVIMCALLANSFTAHHTAPQLRQSLRSSGSSGSTEVSASFDLVIAGGFALSAAVYAVAMVCGYTTFGLECQGNILDNYRASDSLADVARLAMLASVACSFPGMFLGLRDSLQDLLGSTQNAEDAPAWLNPALLTIVTLLAGCCKDLAEASACQGAILGCCLVYAMPILMAASRHGNSAIMHAPSRSSRLQAQIQ